MKVKKMIVPTVSAVLIASQLMGCAAVSKSELLGMINKGEAIEIEAVVPAFAESEQGEESGMLWEVLASLSVNEILRKGWDNDLLITRTDTGKNGMLYVNSYGDNENNNTLRQALHNREFLKQLDDKAMQAKLAKAVREQYADIDGQDSDKKAVYIGINGYFNLIGDNEVNYANADSTIQRNEFMAMVMRAETPVDKDITEDSSFVAAVGQNEFNIYAQSVLDNSYLDLASKSLNNGTYNSSITRAEAVYLLMSRYFGNELSAVDTKGIALSDCKDGGNIAEKQKFIEGGNRKTYWKSYELTYALQNPDNGVPTDLYKAIVLANKKGIIGSETRWDEALTKSEAIEFIVETLKQERGMEQYAYKNGKLETEKSEGFSVETADNTDKEGEDGLTVDAQGVDSKITDEEYAAAADKESEADDNGLTQDGTPMSRDAAIEYLKELGFSDEEIYGKNPGKPSGGGTGTTTPAPGSVYVDPLTGDVIDPNEGPNGSGNDTDIHYGDGGFRPENVGDFVE